ncbi:MAG: type IV secretion system protein [Acidobacteriota bacterium]
MGIPLLVDPADIMQGLQGSMTSILATAKAAWVPVATLQIMYGALAYKFWDRVIWGAFAYPVVGLALLEGYEPVVKALVEIPENLGVGMAYAAFAQALMDIAGKVLTWTALGGFTQSPWDSMWQFLIQGLMVLSVIAAVVIFVFLRLAQVAAIGCLYVIGPLACLCASFGPTSRWSGKWAVMCVECGMWTLIWAVLLKAAVSIGINVQASVPDWYNPLSFAEAFQGIAVMFLYAALTLVTPLFARILVGGGFGVAVGAAAAAMAKSATTAGASTVAGAVVGGAAGGPAGAAGGAALGALSSAGVRGLPSPSSIGKKAA